MSLTTINPATEEPLKTYQEMSAAEVNGIIGAVHKAFHEWKKVSFARRGACFKTCADLLRKNKDRHASLIADEMGKPVAAAQLEIDKCAWACEYYADNAEGFFAPQFVETDGARSYVTFEPLGVILAIMPWNFPFWQVFRFAAPALMAGNGAVLKHAENTMGCAVAIEEIFKEAGFTDNIFRNLIIKKEEAGRVIAHPQIAGVTLSGSVPAGRSVAAQAGAALKKTVLELGGSDPYVILEDADLDTAVEICVKARMNNAGQSCIAAKRLIVVAPLKKLFEEKLVQRMKEFVMGDPHDEAVTLGPLARKDLRDRLHKQVQDTCARGGKCLLGGTLPDRRGYFYPPTVLTDVPPDSPAMTEELFGPVAVIISASDQEEALELANKTNFGLGAAVFTRDRQKGEEIAAKRLAAGNCFVNAQGHSDPRLPFGGIKESGYGRELGRFGIYEFVNIKTVYVK